MTKTMSFNATFGVNAGYDHENENTNAASIVSAEWQNQAAKVFGSLGIYISVVVVDSKTVYNKDWGCPTGGELTATVSSEANPEFVTDLDLWKNSVLLIVKAVKAALEQSTVVVRFSSVDDFIYLTD